ncbi:hypothetical protein V1227_10565 [Lentzea sp. DG1S-22]|uniref:hypothetical protein n=1 Tax=Lentzea sp. DG1S-22 TaxID=3108822 RepID=UPI002E7606A6|nr:hypothetical protein [Lentzea sp. DG1S-22]WVH83164.1 hypothetical protein V1227_10565 [Lentzea sp. DG1S-22]
MFMAVVLSVVFAAEVGAGPGPIAWAAGQDDPGGECGTFGVPLGRDGPRGSAAASRSHVTGPPANPPHRLGAGRAPKTFVLGARHDHPDPGGPGGRLSR